MRRNLDVQRTIKVPAGYKFVVRVDHNILFDSPYEARTADPDFLQSQRALRKRTAP